MTPNAASVVYRFGRFELRPDDRRLLASDKPVPLRPHAFDLLIALVERGGHLVTKDELLQRVWGKVIVEESTLQSHMSALRKVLGAEALTTVSGRGYRIALDVTRSDAAATTPSAPAKHNLPCALTSFVGREKEIDELGRLLGSARLLTLTGSGGCGKTRLAIQFAQQQVNAFPDGAWLVELAPLAGPALLPQAVAAVLGIKEKAGAGVINAIADHCVQRSILLVLDNAEHLLDACARLAELLLQRCPRLVILVTSRERLAITGELTYRVPSLSIPDEGDVTPERIAASESARLFLDRARLQLPHFHIAADNSVAIASICRRLDGIALALELAAPRLRLLSVEELSRRLDQRFELLTEGSRTALPRHRTLRSLIDWSYDLLNLGEQALLRRLSVFSGGWTLDAAEHMCREAINSGNALELLTSLVDKNLITIEGRNGTTRYGMLETVRQYARQRLNERGEEPFTLRCHTARLLTVAEEAYSKDLGASHDWLDRFELEIDNVRVALAWSLSLGGDVRSGLLLAGALNWFWQVRHTSEGRSWISRLLAAAPATEDDPGRIRALRVATVLAIQADDFADAETLAKQVLASCRRIGHIDGADDALEMLGHVARGRGDFPAAIECYEQCLEIRRKLGQRGAEAISLWGLGKSALGSGDLGMARSWLEQSVAILREVADWRIAYSLLALGEVDYAEHDLVSTKERLAETLRVGRDIGLPLVIGSALIWLALVAHDEGKDGSARESLNEALRIFRDLDAPLEWCMALEAFAAMARTAHGGLAAARLWGSAERKREEIETPIPAYRLSWFEGEILAARAASSDNVAFDAAWREGRAMTLEQAAKYAVGLDASSERR